MLSFYFLTWNFPKHITQVFIPFLPSVTSQELMLVAALLKDLNLLKYCISKGADLEYTIYGENVLHCALDRFPPSLEIVEYLLASNVKVNWVHFQCLWFNVAECNELFLCNASGITSSLYEVQSSIAHF